MINLNKSAILRIGLFVLVFGQYGSIGLAADCNVLHDEISNERVLMKKRALVAQALAQCPDDPAIVYQDGYILERLRKYKEALVRYRKAIALDAGYAKAHFSIGDIEALQNNYSEAIKAYSEGLRYEPDNERARGSLESLQAQYKGNVVAENNGKSPVTADTAKPVVDLKKAETIKQVAQEKVNPVIAPITRLSIPFGKKSDALSQDAKDVLGVVVGQAMTRSDSMATRFEIGGYADDSGNAAKNKELANKRALAVQKFLTDNFAIDPNRFKITAYGQDKPMAGGGNRVGFVQIN